MHGLIFPLGDALRSPSTSLDFSAKFILKVKKFSN